MDGLLAVWSDGKKDTNAIVKQWQDSFKAITNTTRVELQELKASADEAGYSSVSDSLAADIAQLDAIDKEMDKLIKRRQNRSFTEKDKQRMQELIDMRGAIEIKYHLSEADTEGFDTIRKKLEAEVARAQARGQQDASTTVYENAMVASAEGMAAVNRQLDEQYDKEYAVTMLIEDNAERQAALDDLNVRYLSDRKAAAQEYAALLASIVMPVWNQQDIQQAGTDMDKLVQLMRQYTTVGEDEKPAILEQMNQLTAGMDEGAMTEYVAVLTQIQSLLDSGMTDEEVSALFPEIDYTSALEQIAAIQAFLNSRPGALPGLEIMFGEALPEEVLKIATDLDMTGAQERWNEFAANPGSITTNAVIQSYSEATDVIKQQPKVDAFISKYTEVPEGADKTALTPTGLVAYVTKYAEVTNGADVSGITPLNITALVAAYAELAEGADITQLTPDEITAYIKRYLEANDVDTTGLTPEALTAFVLAYEEITGGANTTALTPDDITAWVVKYLEAEDVDVSKLTPDQIEALVSSFAEALGCDKSTLLQNFVAYIGEAATLRITTSDDNVGDTTSVYKVTDGATGATGSAGASASVAFLTNENITFAGNASGAVAATSVTCNVVAYKGTTKTTPTVGTVSGAVTGMTITKDSATSNEIPITIAIAANSTLGTTAQTSGVLSVPVTAPVSTTLKINWSKVNTGATGAAGADGADAIVFSLYAPSGTVFQNGSGTLTIQTAAYEGASAITSGATYAWAKYASGSWTTISGQTGSSLSVDGSTVSGMASYRCTMTYGGKTYTDVITLTDKTDNYQATIDSTGGDVFKNTVGTSTLTCRLFQNGEEVDAEGTEHTYTWYRWDKDGNALDSGEAFATGKSINVDGDDVDVKTTFVCEVT